MIIISLCAIVLGTLPLTAEPIMISSPPLGGYDKEFMGWSRTFAETIHYTRKHSYVNISPEEAMLKAMNAFVSFDPHSSVLDPSSYTELLSKREFFGIGVILAPKQQQEASITINDILSESPAEKSGLQPQDRIIAINSTTVINLTHKEIAEQLRGKEKSDITLTLVKKQGNIVTLTLTRDTIKEEDTYAYTLLHNRFLYVALLNFNTQTMIQLSHFLSQALSYHIEGLIMDLRGNTGGSLQAAVDCLSLFLPHDSIVVTIKNRHQESTDVFRTQGEPLVPFSLPSIILIDRTTASAAEMYAAALAHQEHRFLFTLGTVTFGKGSVQEVVPLSNNCALKLTTGLYELPHKGMLQGNGLAPDFVREQRSLASKEELLLHHLFSCEKALPHSIQVDGRNKSPLPLQTPLSLREQRLQNDYQLQQAITILNCFIYAHSVDATKVIDRNAAVTFLKRMLIEDNSIDFHKMKLK
jgi:carboxyl-terminal processing protease